jgi:parallel beta-helix repeat protein
MKRILVMLCVLTGAMVSATVMAATHSPITILGNSDFTAENGVVAGTGTASDPYVISGWEITLGAQDKYGVKIENASASFVLRGLLVQGGADALGAALRIGFSSGGRVEQCAISGALNGIEIISSEGITIRECVVYASGTGLRVEGESAEEYRHDIDASNVLNDREILYYYGLDGETIGPATTTHLTVADSRDVTIEGVEVINGDGIQLAFVRDSVVSGNSAYRTSPMPTQHGITLYQSTGNTIIANSVRNNRLAGIQVTLSDGNRIEANAVWANDSGIRLLGSDANVVTGNHLVANPTAIYLAGGSSGNTVEKNVIEHKNTKQGIDLELAVGNVIEKNGITEAEIAVVISAQASNNVISGNTILNGGYGISLSGSYNRIEGNLIAQESRGLLCPETFTKTMTRGNVFVGNVFSDNNSHVYVNLDSDVNRFSRNAFLGSGVALVADQGPTNEWSIDGVGNYWEGTPVIDHNGDGIGESFVTVYPAAGDDRGPLVAFDPVEQGVGILGSLKTATLTVHRADGTALEVEALLAEEGVERWTGFRGFPAKFAGSFPGILFVFDSEDSRSFTMSTVLFDLDIAFFNAEGAYVGGTAMTANATDLYTASGPFQYALELPSGSLSTLGIGLGTQLQIP